MIQWFEGKVLSCEPSQEDPNLLRLSVKELQQGYRVDGVQLHLKDSFQERPSNGSTIAFYRDSAATSKYGFLLSDATPIASPIAIETAIKALEDGELVFYPGEVALSAKGNREQLLPTKGGTLWLRNCGDGAFFSGSYQERIVVSDSSKSVDIEGTNIDIYAHGNLLTTHAFNIDSNLAGVTTLNLGLKNPITGVFITRLRCDSFGAFTIGAEDPTLGSFLSGLSYNLIPSLPAGPFLVPECKLTSIPLTSQLTVNPAGTTINGAVITLGGVAPSIPGIPAPSVNVNIIAASTTIGPGALSVVGATSITGTTSITGATSITPLLSIISPIVFTFTGPIFPATGALAAAAGITHQVPVLINNLPFMMALRQGAGWV